MSTCHSKLLCFFIHKSYKITHRTRNGVCQRYAALCTGRKHDSVEKINCLHCLIRLKSSLHCILHIKIRYHIVCNRNLLIQVLEIFNRKDCSHDLCHRSRIHLFFTIDIIDDFATLCIHEHRIRAVDPCDIQFLDCRFTDTVYEVGDSCSQSQIMPHDHYKNDNYDQFCSNQTLEPALLFSSTVISFISCIWSISTFLISHTAPSFLLKFLIIVSYYHKIL